MKPIVIQEHRDDCWGVEAVTRGDWIHPWTMAKYDWPGYDKIGRKNPRSSRLFLVYRCNSPACPARLGFLASDVEKALGLRDGEEPE